MLCVADSSLIEQINLGQVLIILTFISGFYVTTKKFTSIITDWFNEKLKPNLTPIENALSSISSKVDALETDSLKRYLVLFMSNVERGETPDEVELELFDEVYKKYVESGGNSYIHRKYDKLKAEGKL